MFNLGKHYAEKSVKLVSSRTVKLERTPIWVGCYVTTINELCAINLWSCSESLIGTVISDWFSSKESPIGHDTCFFDMIIVQQNWWVNTESASAPTEWTTYDEKCIPLGQKVSSCKGNSHTFIRSSLLSEKKIEKQSILLHGHQNKCYHRKQGVQGLTLPRKMTLSFVGVDEGLSFDFSNSSARCVLIEGLDFEFSRKTHIQPHTPSPPFSPPPRLHRRCPIRVRRKAIRDANI